MTRPHPSPPISNIRPVPRATVCVVDDDQTMVETLTALLVAEGYAVEGFTDPAAALTRLSEESPPDLALIDCIMPVLTGSELREALVERGVEVPVVLMTGLADPSFCVHPEHGSVLGKPFLVEDLIAEIEARLGEDYGAGASGVRPASRISESSASGPGFGVVSRRSP